LLTWARHLGIELGTLLASLLKWTLLAAAAGTLAGSSTALFLRVLAVGIAAAQSATVPLLLLPLGFLVAFGIVHVVAPEAEGHGTDRVIEAVHRRWGRIPFLVAPVKLVATVVTIAAGGSVGKEGPAAQIGAALASALGRPAVSSSPGSPQAGGLWDWRRIRGGVWHSDRRLHLRRRGLDHGQPHVRRAVSVVRSMSAIVERG
jgi:H+/Cl- antiporter ClcA